jgi:hypothetical protein
MGKNKNHETEEGAKSNGGCKARVKKTMKEQEAERGNGKKTPLKKEGLKQGAKRNGKKDPGPQKSVSSRQKSFHSPFSRQDPRKTSLEARKTLWRY